MKFTLEHEVTIDGTTFREIHVRAATRKEVRRHFNPKDQLWGLRILADVTRIPEATLLEFNGDDLERMATLVAQLSSTGGR
ncbi:MAG: phage tail assembly protein [Gammaproteobacteria bacterium]|nr:phage tail assembly protein [Gammaproteobacteria bacterium]